MKKGKKTMVIVALLIVVILVIAIITAVVSSNRSKQNGQGFEQSKEEFTASLDGKYAENDNVKISIDDMSYVGNNLIIKYDVVSKDGNAKLFENAYNELDEFDFHLNRRIKINFHGFLFLIQPPYPSCRIRSRISLVFSRNKSSLL